VSGPQVLSALMLVVGDPAVSALTQRGYVIAVVRTRCYDCGGWLKPRVEWAFNPLHPRWGSWCPWCYGWWPWVDDFGRECDCEDQPAPYRLRDDPFRVTPSEPTGE
jgi:hypothetical protein